MVPLARDELPFTPGIAGHRVRAIAVEGPEVAISLVGPEATASTQVRVRGAFSISQWGDTARCDPGSDARPARDLVFRDVLEARVDRDGALRLSLEGGVEVIAGPDPEVTAWELRNRDTFLTCLPGDGGVVGWVARRHQVTGRTPRSS